MKLRKGQVLVFAEKARPNETITKASNDPVNGTVKTDRSEYSTDFIKRWMNFGFCQVFKACEVPAELVK